MSDYVANTPRQEAYLRKRIKTLKAKLAAEKAEEQDLYAKWRIAVEKETETNAKYHEARRKLRAGRPNPELPADRARRKAERERKKALHDYVYERAENRHQWWTPEEDEALLGDPRSDFDLALALGRTLSSVETRRGLLKNGKIEYKSASSVRRQTRTGHTIGGDLHESA